MYTKCLCQQIHLQCKYSEKTSRYETCSQGVTDPIARGLTFKNID